MAIRNKIADLLSSNGFLTPDQIEDPNFSLFGSGHLSSMDLLNIVLEVESFIGFALDEKYLVLENFDNIVSIERLVDRVLGDKARVAAAS